MKRILSLILSIVTAVCTLTAVSFSASANSMTTAVPVSLGQVYSTSVCDTVESSYKSWIKFDCTADGYYELTCTSKSAPYGALYVTVFDSGKNTINFSSNGTSQLSFKTVTYLYAWQTYYFCIETDGTLCELDAVIDVHNHLYTNVQTVRAVADDTAEISRDGFTRFACSVCGSYYDAGAYSCPSNVVLSTTKYTYNGVERRPAVTVYDKSGAVISPAEYIVTYEDNILPGKAFVTVTFNSLWYDGELTKSFLIVPSKQAVTYLKSKKSRSISVKWNKDNNASGYELQYSTSPKFYKSKTVTVNISKKSTYSKTISNLKSKKTYYARVRSYKTIGGVKYYGSWSAKQRVKTLK